MSGKHISNDCQTVFVFLYWLAFFVLFICFKKDKVWENILFSEPDILDLAQITFIALGPSFDLPIKNLPITTFYYIFIIYKHP